MSGLKVTVTNLATAAVAVYLSTTAPAVPVANAAIPHYYVVFRANGAATFHLGALGEITNPVSPEPYNLKSHRVKIEDITTGAVLYDQERDDHWWNSQWTYRPGPIAIIKTPAQIVADNRMFIFGRVPGMKEAATLARSPAGDTFMPYYWVTTYMPTTGERRDLGLVSDDGAQAMMGKQTQGLIDGAIAGGTAPIHYRDEKTGKPIDVSKNVFNHYSLKGYQPGKWLDPGPPIPPSGPDPTAPGYDRGSDGWHTQGGGHWQVQIAHLAELSYLAHKFTNDPIFLEDLQYMAEFAAIGDDGVWSGPDRNQPPPIPTSEYRGEAWIGRTVVMAWIATRDAEEAGTLPATCNPSSSFKPVIDAIRDRYLKVVNNPDKNIQAFRLLNGAPRMGPWQHEYNMLFLSFTQLVGMKDWEPIYLWGLKNTIDRALGTRGWPVGYGGAYYLNTVRGGGEPWPDADSQKRNLGIDPPIPKPADYGKKFETWAEVFEDMHLYGRVTGAPSGLTDAQYAALVADPLFGGGLINVTGRGYTQNTHAVLAAAAYLDYKKLAGVKAVYPELDTCIANIERQLAGDEFNPRASIVNDPTAPPIVVTPLPPVTEIPPVENPPTNPQPPNPGTTMDFVQGVTVPLYLKPDGKTYGVNITTTPPGQINTTQPVGPDSSGAYTLSFTPVIDLTEEDFTISAFVRTDPTDASKGFTKTFSGRDVRKAATAEGTKFDTTRPG